VADASGFPTASGVNPMLSVMALAYRVAQRIKAGYTP
jgi:choline dehydrogenase-like flavoprotein